MVVGLNAIQIQIEGDDGADARGTYRSFVCCCHNKNERGWKFLVSIYCIIKRKGAEEEYKKKGRGRNRLSNFRHFLKTSHSSFVSSFCVCARVNRQCHSPLLFGCNMKKKKKKKKSFRLYLSWSKFPPPPSSTSLILGKKKKSNVQREMGWSNSIKSQSRATDLLMQQQRARLNSICRRLTAVYFFSNPCCIHFFFLEFDILSCNAWLHLFPIPKCIDLSSSSFHRLFISYMEFLYMYRERFLEIPFLFLYFLFFFFTWWKMSITDHHHHFLDVSPNQSLWNKRFPRIPGSIYN